MRNSSRSKNKSASTVRSGKSSKPTGFSFTSWKMIVPAVAALGVGSALLVSKYRKQNDIADGGDIEEVTY